MHSRSFSFSRLDRRLLLYSRRSNSPCGDENEVDKEPVKGEALRVGGGCLLQVNPAPREIPRRKMSRARSPRPFGHGAGERRVRAGRDVDAGQSQQG